MCDACCTAAPKQAQRLPGCMEKLHTKACLACSLESVPVCRDTAFWSCIAPGIKPILLPNELIAGCSIARLWHMELECVLCPLKLCTRVLTSVATMRQARLVLPQALATKWEHHLDPGPAAAQGVNRTIGTGSDCSCLSWGTSHLRPDLVLLLKLLQLFLLLLQLLFKVLHQLESEFSLVHLQQPLWWWGSAEEHELHTWSSCSALPLTSGSTSATVRWMSTSPTCL